MKICSKCKRELPIDNFYKDCSTKDGLRHRCKECIKNDNQASNYARQKKWKAKNKEHIKRQTKEYKLKNKEEIKTKSKLYYLKNKEACYQRTAKWRKNNIEKVRENGNRYYAENIERYRDIKRKIQQKRIAQQNNLLASLTISEWKECKAFFFYKCAYCGCEVKTLHQEHVIPLSQSGNYTRDNIVPACGKCNSSKRNSNMEEWYHKQEFFDMRKLDRIYRWIGKEKKAVAMI
jgi:hypothetical protein